MVGTAPDGRPYAASDPVLIEWVHATEVHSFLMSWRAFGYRRLTPDEEDRYLDEMSRVALALGARQVPRTVIALEAISTRSAPSWRSPTQAQSARDFILRGVGRWPHELASYGILMAAAQSTLPGWARRQLRLISVPAGDRLMVRPAARALGTAMRWVVLDEAGSGHGRQRRPPTPRRLRPDRRVGQPDGPALTAAVRLRRSSGASKHQIGRSDR